MNIHCFLGNFSANFEYYFPLKTHSKSIRSMHPRSQDPFFILVWLIWPQMDKPLNQLFYFFLSIFLPKGTLLLALLLKKRVICSKLTLVAVSKPVCHTCRLKVLQKETDLMLRWSEKHYSVLCVSYKKSIRDHNLQLMQLKTV